MAARRDSDAGLLRRAMVAYFRTGGTEQPSRASGVQEHNGHRYVVLRAHSATLAVYRIRNDGMLKRVGRWPRELEQR